MGCLNALPLQHRQVPSAAARKGVRFISLVREVGENPGSAGARRAAEAPPVVVSHGKLVRRGYGAIHCLIAASRRPNSRTAI